MEFIEPKSKVQDKEFTSKAEISTIADCQDKMIYDLLHGKEKGSTTHIEAIDNCWRWRNKEFNIWTGYQNEGKALDIETYIPTPRGFAFMRDIEVGDEVFDEHGQICNVIATTGIMYDHKCYRITFSDGFDIVADAQHQWLVDNRQTRASKSRQLKRKTLKKRGKDQRNKCLMSEILTTEQLFEGMKNNKVYSIPLTKEVQYQRRDLIIDPYLFGAWLGDGDSAGGGMTSADPQIMERFSQAGFTVTKRSSKYRYGILKFTEKLDALGVIKNKHIPEEYLRSSVEQRMELLKGLMDTDGFTDKLGRCEFTTISGGLAKQVYRLISSLGIKVYVTEDEARLNGRYISQRYRLRFKTTKEVFYLQRKLDRQLSSKPPKNNCHIIKSIVEVSSVPVKCIQVDSPNNMYLCTEACIPTHNSQLIRYLSIIKVLMDNWRFLFCAPEDYPADEFFDDLVHTILGRTTDKDRPDCVDERLYREAIKIIKDNIIFVYIKPPYNTIRGVLEEFKPLIDKYKVNACIIDPLIKFARPKDFSERDDIYAAYITSICTDFCREFELSLHLVMHQLTPRELVDGYYQKPTGYAIKGGGTWIDGCDNVLSIWRPQYAKDKFNTQVMFSSQKIKKQKLVGIPQDFNMRFNRKTNRFVDYNDEQKDLFQFPKVEVGKLII